jgi:hypothetical protein
MPFLLRSVTEKSPSLGGSKKAGETAGTGWCLIAIITERWDRLKEIFYNLREVRG